MTFQLAKLPYNYDALEPYIDKETVEIHHDKHHQAYTDKFNKALESYPELYDKTAEEILRDLNKLDVDEATRTAIKNHGGGHVNHNIYWDSMAPQKQEDADLIKEIEETFGSLADFKNKFTELATKQFASGWAWLVRDENGKPEAYSLPNQDSPYTLGHTPIFNIDVWEHAYYLKYQNKRPDYIANWWNLLKYF